MRDALPWIGLVAGVGLILVTLSSVLITMVIPRSANSVITSAVARVVRGSFTVVAGRFDEYTYRDRVLAMGAPTFLMVLLVTWIGLLVLGFGLMMWPAQGSFPAGMRLAGSSMFTLGFVAPDGAGPTALVFCAAAAGLGVVALEISYLPTLYGAFNRRERLVTMLEFLGGVPAWGPEILARHELIDNVSKLGWLYEQWTEWAADVSESHTTYRTLVYFRSPQPMRSWVIGLLSVLDAAALHLSLNPLSAPADARPLLRMGYVAMQELARDQRLPFNPDPLPEDPIMLTREEFDAGVAHLEQAGWNRERTTDEAWIHFRGWRVNYEQAAYELAARLDAPPAFWSGPRRRRRTTAQAPDRPPHREPRDVDRLRTTTAQRRAVRRTPRPPTTPLPPD
jgi:hypothetical protein